MEHDDFAGPSLKHKLKIKHQWLRLYWKNPKQFQTEILKAK